MEERVAVTLPDLAVTRLLNGLQNPNAEAILKPGIPISIQLTLSGTGANADLNKKITEQLTRNIERLSFVVREGAPVTLTVSAAGEFTGKSVEYFELLKNEKFTINIMKVDASQPPNVVRKE